MTEPSAFNIPPPDDENGGWPRYHHLKRQHVRQCEECQGHNPYIEMYIIQDCPADCEWCK